MKLHSWLSMLCGGLCVAAQAQTVVENFEYATDDDLVAAWIPSANATITLSDSVAPKSAGKKSLRIDYSFPSTAWATETVRGPALPASIVIGTNQYVSLRIRG